MNEPNFYCKITDIQYYIPRFSMRIIVQDGISITEYIDKSTQKVVQSEEGLMLFPIEKKGDYTTQLGSSNSQTKTKLVRNLRERSKNHYEKEIKDVKMDMIKRSTPNN